MENTGRIRKLLSPTARKILFGRSTSSMIDDELPFICSADCAHLVMLAECGICDPQSTARLLRAIQRLMEADFDVLRGRDPVRGMFLLYEDYLIETEGAEVGGILQTARSRNDLNATVTKMRLRKPYIRLLSEILKFEAILLRRVEAYLDVVMPAYTHGQPAAPSTLGHYLAGFTQALMRDFDGLLDAGRNISQSPLGSCAIAGTSFPIDTRRTAQLLGFDEGPVNSVDAIASRDLVLRILAAASICGITLSRLATDLLEWSTAEFGFLDLPDELVGSSSAMPQKRNPFLLEHVKGRTASILGAFVASASAMRGTPFTNSIAVGTEAIKPVWAALDELTDSVVLLRIFVAGLRPKREAMMQCAKAGFTVATELANKLVARAGMDFRSAHRAVGQAITAVGNKESGSVEAIAAEVSSSRGISILAEELEPAFVAQASVSGGGPARSSVETCLQMLKQRWLEQKAQSRSYKRTWLNAEAQLEDAVQTLRQCS
ncbi:MAG TPA: argininosuccinate lyase [Candidatus Angelobacter sp.]|jgi:argininosuccinate lyase